MLFNSFIFLIFLGAVIPVFYAIKSKTGRNTFLLLASYFFYGYWDWRFCSLLLISTLVDFYVGKKLYKTEKGNTRKRLLLISIVANLGILGSFKYFNFFTESFATLLKSMGGHPDFVHLNIILPVGISFYTFQTMTYSIDIYRRRLTPTNSLIDFALYVSFFPQLVAGPIERAAHLLPQLSRKFGATRAQFEKGIVLIVMGLFKKVMIGDTAGRIVDRIFGQPDLYHSPELLMALILFAIQIYADFSGY
ncbi:MAG: MBOAT family O-acyltransferase, partial [Calditrichota bacterium]